LESIGPPVKPCLMCIIIYNPSFGASLAFLLVAVALHHTTVIRNSRF
jgi:hypothetical protein